MFAASLTNGSSLFCTPLKLCYGCHAAAAGAHYRRAGRVAQRGRGAVRAKVIVENNEWTRMSALYICGGPAREFY